MTIKFPKSFAGIIEAIKTKSGSTKFYKPNYEGVILAILDWTGGGGGINIIYPPAGLPPTGEDGDMIGYPDEDGNWFIYIWADGDWQRTSVYTTDVIPDPPGGVFPGSNVRKDITTPDGVLLTDQRDINWYLYELALDRVCREEELESNGDALPITESQYAVIYDPLKNISSIYLHPDTWENVFNEDSKSIWIDGEPYVIVEVITADGAMIVVNVEGEVETTAGETAEFNSCQPIGGGKQMVFYGELPPDKAPEGAIFTQEDSLKQFVHIGDGVWVEHTSCVGDGKVIEEEKTYVRFTKYAYITYSNNHNGQSIIAGKVDIWWASEEGKNYYDGDWYWEVDMFKDDTWIKHEDLPQEFLDKINFRFQNKSSYQYEAAPGSTESSLTKHPDYPCARVRFTGSNYSSINANDFTVETSEPTPMFPNTFYSDTVPPAEDVYFPCPNPRDDAVKRKRARNVDGTYRADDPSTPDINEAWEQ